MSTTMIEAIWKDTHGTDIGLAEALPELEKMLNSVTADLKANGTPGNIAYTRAREVVAKAIASRKAEVSMLKFKDVASKRFIERGGTPEEFAKAWPEIRAEHLRNAALRDQSESELAHKAYASQMAREY